MIYPDYVDAYPRNAATLILGYTPPSREQRRLARAEQRRRNKENGWDGHLPGTGPGARKRRPKPFGKHNKDRYHK